MGTYLVPFVGWRIKFIHTKWLEQPLLPCAHYLFALVLLLSQLQGALFNSKQSKWYPRGSMQLEGNPRDHNHGGADNS